MGVQWKTKQAMRSLASKSTLAHQSNILSPALQMVGEEEELPPPAPTCAESFVLQELWEAPVTTEIGDYQSLSGDDTFLYWAGARSRTEWYLRKIRISDMTEVTSISRTENAYDFVSVSVVGDYVYVGLGWNEGTNPITPRILKFNKANLIYVDTLLLSGSPKNFAELYPDQTNASILWVGSQKPNAFVFYPMIFKVNLSSFSIDSAKEYASPIDNGCPAIAMDSTYLYVFMKYGGRFKVLKTNLDSVSNFTEAAFDSTPRRYLRVVETKVYVIFEAYKLSRFNTSDLTEDYYYDAFGSESPSSWIEGLVYFTLHPERIFVVDMEPTSSIWRFSIGASAFTKMCFWAVPHANRRDIYSCWYYTSGANRTYIFMADWRGASYSDAIYKIEVLTF